MEHAEKRDYTVRRKLQRFFKHLTRRRSIPFDSDGSLSCRCDSKLSTSKPFSTRRESYNFNSSRANGNKRNNYRSYSDSETNFERRTKATHVVQAQRKKHTDSKISHLNCFKSSTKKDDKVTMKRAGDAQSTEDTCTPLVDTVFTDCPARIATDSRHPNYQYGRRSSRSRHSTTTIETRITMNGGTKDPEEVCTTAV